MAEPASAEFPSPDNRVLIVRELQSHVDKFARHLQSAIDTPLHAQKVTFLQEFSDNIDALDKLIKSITLQDIELKKRKPFAENLDILECALTLSIESDKSVEPLSLLKAIKNISAPSPKESDLGKFMVYIEKYAESIRVLIQELKLISEELSRFI